MTTSQRLAYWQELEDLVDKLAADLDDKQLQSLDRAMGSIHARLVTDYLNGAST